MHSSYTMWLVVLSVMMSIFGSFTALSLAARVRRAAGRARTAWLLLAAVAMGGGIWAMHFIAMLAFHIQVPVTYDVALTLMSLLLAIVFTGLGQWLVAVRGSGAFPLLLGGTAMGLGVNTMHYTGMAAMRMPAVITYDPGLVALSVAIAIVAGTAALWLSFNLSSLGSRLLSAVVMAAAVCGMHYTGMAAANYALCTGEYPNAAMSSSLLAIAIGVATFAILCLALLLAIVDQQFEARANEEAERARRDEQRFRSLIRNSVDVIMVIDADGVTRFVSPSVERILGYEPEALLGAPPARLVAGDDQEELRLLVQTIRTAPESNLVREFQLIHADGRIGDFEVVCNNLLTDSAVNGIVVNIRDISTRRENAELERRIAERTSALASTNRELVRAKELAEAANRLKSQFLATVTHELRTPLNAIIGFSDILRGRAIGSPVEASDMEYSGDINDSGRHLLNLVNNILDLSKIEAGAFELREDCFELERAVAAALRMVVPLARQGQVDLRADGLDPDLLLHADETMVIRVLVNLISNAVKFTGPGGTVRLSSFRLPDGALRLTIADTGIGIAAEDISRVLSPFSQVDSSLARRHQGTGLGLPLAKSLIELHEGSLDIASEPGRGTTVSAVFPAHRVGDEAHARRRAWPSAWSEPGLEPILLGR